MTLDEKLQQLHGIRDASHFRFVPPLPRLGIPAFQITNGPAGAGPGGTRPQAKATALPAPISLAATWDPGLAKLNGAIIGEESKDIGNSLVEAPTINIARVPQNGRTFEGYGEDPYLISRMSVSNIIGMQSQGVIANVKHYAANNQETNRLTVNEEIDERTLREIYLPAFEASVKQGHVASLMCAYPRVNGTYCCENDLLLNQILKKAWGFDGFVTSDFGAVHSTVASAAAGLDLEMPTGKYFGDDDLKSAVQSGQVPVSVIDDKLIRRFRAMMRFGIFDHPPSPKPIPAEKNGAIALRLAEEGIVLLKNDDGALPLNAAHLRSIAVIGPAAVHAVTGGGGSSRVAPLYTVDPVDGIRRRVGANVTVSFADGGDVAQAVSLARAADVAVLMVGDVNTEGRDHPLALDGNQDALVQAVAAANPRTVVVVKSGSAVLMPWADRVPAILEAWYPGEEDGNAVAALLFGDFNPSGKLPITFPKSVDDLPANTAEQYPGAGTVEPYKNAEFDMNVKAPPGPGGVAHYSEGVFVGYRHYDARGIVPLFPFGHGLSYTSFAYKDLKISADQVSFDGKRPPTVSVDATVINSGKVRGAEVVQLYVGLPSIDGVPEPPKQLKGFEKVMLEAGRQARVHMVLDARSLSYWDVKNHAWAVVPGDYEIMVGASSRDIRLHGRFKVTADAVAGAVAQ
ncbi:MAG TPA: glycoside hydrolase family 3 C-terminal domain-containing protein [Candidatus Angelobacter sp.]